MEKVARHPMDELDAHEIAVARRWNRPVAPYMSPDEHFYLSNYIFDGCLAANLRSHYGYFASAKKQLFSFTATQRASGMVPGVSHPPTLFSVNPERWLSTAPFEGNDYTQTPDWARSILYLYDYATSKSPARPDQVIDPEKMVREIYPHVDRYYRYFPKWRQVASGDPRVFLLHPNEANRDSAPENDEWKRAELERQFGRTVAKLLKRKPRSDEHMPTWFNYYNRTVDYVGAIAINLAGYKAGWDPQRIRESTGEFVDVWFNAHLCENYVAMARLAEIAGKDEDVSMYSDWAQRLETAMEVHYDKDAHGGLGSYYSTYNGQMQRKDAIGNLASLLLPNAPEENIRSNLDIMDAFFDTPYLLSCISTADIGNWDPGYEEPNLHWHNGTVWIVANGVVRRGLRKHIGVTRKLALPEDLHTRSAQKDQAIWESSVKAVEVTGGYAEHHNPYNGIGQRPKTAGHTFGIPLLDP